MSACAVCRKAIKQADTGRKRIYCSQSCKSKAKRRLESERDRASKAAVGFWGEPAPDAAPAGSDPGPDVPLCHTCMTEPATVGSPRALLCVGCARPSVDAP